MPLNFGGLTQGLQAGVNLGLTLEQAERQREQDKRAQDERQYQRQRQVRSDERAEARFELDRESTRIANQTRRLRARLAENEVERKATQRAVQGTLYQLGSLQDRDNPIQYLHDNPDARNALKGGLQPLADLYAQSNHIGDDNTVEVADVIAMPEKNGLAFKLKVSAPDGSSYFAPLTRNGSAEASDPVKVFGLDEIARGAIGLDALVDQVEGYGVSQGLTGPLTARREAAAAEAEAARDEDKANADYAREVTLEQVKATLKARAKRMANQDKVPQWERELLDLAAQTFGSALGDNFAFAGNNADKSAYLAELSRQAYIAQPADDKSITRAHNQALNRFRERGGPITRQEASRQAEAERGATLGFGGKSDADVQADAARRWREARGLALDNPSDGKGNGRRNANAAPYSDGTRLRGQDGRVYVVIQGQPVPEDQASSSGAGS